MVEQHESPLDRNCNQVTRKGWDLPAKGEETLYI